MGVNFRLGLVMISHRKSQCRHREEEEDPQFWSGSARSGFQSTMLCVGVMDPVAIG